MEDAHIATSLSDFRNYLFAIFDGHGGCTFFIQARKSHALYKETSLENWRKTLIIKRKIMNGH